MPTYEYLCKSCGERLEVQQSFTDASLTECPRCSGALRKVFGNVGITFKGSGFYKTDSRKSSSSSTSTSSTGSSGEASGSTSGASTDGGSGSATPASTGSGTSSSSPSSGASSDT